MRLHVTLRAEVVAPTGRRVVVRLGVWDAENLRRNFTTAVRDAYEGMLARHPDVRKGLTARHGEGFAFVSVFVRPGPPGLRPGDDPGLDAWLARPPAGIRGQYREAVIADLTAAGYELLPTDTVYVDEAGVALEDPLEGHYDIVVTDLAETTLDRLLELFSEAIPKPKTRPGR
jgi:hypothetical protein